MCHLFAEMNAAGKSESIQKNVYLKMMCWLHNRFEDLVPLLGADCAPKVLYANSCITGHELAFLKILNSLGTDILLLEPRGDNAYMQLDPSGMESQLLSDPDSSPFPSDFSLKSFRNQSKPGPQFTARPDENLTALLETDVASVQCSDTEALIAAIDVNNLETIITFGAGCAEGIAGVSEQTLRSMAGSPVEDAGKALNALKKIMDQFDMGGRRPSRFSRVFGKWKADRILSGYHAVGDELDSICAWMKQCEEAIRQDGVKLESLFRSNVAYYKDLVKYIAAGEQGCREIRDRMDRRHRDMKESGDRSILFELETLKQAGLMLEERTRDLRTAEIIALQSIPMLKAIQFSNMNLARKINSAFIVTLPVFKQALTQALMRRQRKVYILNETMPVGNSTLETAWRTIMNGIGETCTLQEDAIRQRRENQRNLAQSRQEIRNKYQPAKESLFAL